MKNLKSPKIIILLVLVVALVVLGIWGVTLKSGSSGSQPSQEEQSQAIAGKIATAREYMAIAESAVANLDTYQEQIQKNYDTLSNTSIEDLVVAMSAPAAETESESDGEAETSEEEGSAAEAEESKSSETLEMNEEVLNKLDKALEALENSFDTSAVSTQQTTLVSIFQNDAEGERLIEPYLSVTDSVISKNNSFIQSAQKALKEIKLARKRIQNKDKDPADVAEEYRDEILNAIDKEMKTLTANVEDAKNEFSSKMSDRMEKLAAETELSNITKHLNLLRRSLKKITKVDKYEAYAVRSYETLLKTASDNYTEMIHDYFPGLDLGEQFSQALDTQIETATVVKEATFKDFISENWDRLLWLAGILLLVAALAFLKSGKPETHKLIVDSSKKNMMLVALVMIIVIFFVLTNYTLLTPTNVSNIINQNAYIIILACGMLLCIICSANIDLSVGRVMGFIGACAAKFMIENNMPVYLAVPICLLIGVVIGAWQGFWIAYMKIPAFVVTLAGQLTFYGLTMMILQGLTINNFPDSFKNMFSSYVPDYFGMAGFNLTTMLIGVAVVIVFILIQITGRANRVKKGYPVDSVKAMWIKTGIISIVLLWLFYSMAAAQGLPTVLFTVAIVLLLYLFITSRTVLGRHLYAMGGNVNAARLSGVKTQKMLFLAYVNMGFLAALAGLAYAARLNAASPQAGQGDELYAIASCYIGGASAYGGIGTVGGALIGAMSMGVIKNGMSIMSLGQDIQQIVLGMVLLSAVVIDIVSKSSGSSSLPLIGKLHARKEKKAEAVAASKP